MEVKPGARKVKGTTRRRRRKRTTAGGSPKITTKKTRKPRTRPQEPQKLKDSTTKRLRTTKKPRTRRTAAPTQTHAFTATLAELRSRTFKTSMTSIAALPTSTQPTPITLFGMDITDFVTGIESWFNALGDPVKYAMVGGAVFLVLLVVFCCYRKFVANTEAPPQQTVVIVQEEPRRKRRPWSRARFRSSITESRGKTPSSTSRSKGSRSIKELRHRYSAKQKRPPDRTRQGGRTAEPEAGTAVEKRGKSYEDRQAADVFKAQTAPTMEGTAGTAATDETMQSTDGPLPFPPPPPPPPGAGPMRAVGRVALSLRQLLRRSSDDKGPARADILDMMGNVPENALDAPPPPGPPPPAAGGTRSSGTAPAPGYEEVGGLDKALLPGPATQPKRW